MQNDAQCEAISTIHGKKKSSGFKNQKKTKQKTKKENQIGGKISKDEKKKKQKKSESDGCGEKKKTEDSSPAAPIWGQQQPQQKKEKIDKKKKNQDGRRCKQKNEKKDARIARTERKKKFNGLRVLDITAKLLSLSCKIEKRLKKLQALSKCIHDNLKTGGKKKLSKKSIKKEKKSKKKVPTEDKPLSECRFSPDIEQKLIHSFEFENPFFHSSTGELSHDEATMAMPMTTTAAAATTTTTTTTFIPSSTVFSLPEAASDMATGSYFADDLFTSQIFADFW